MDLRSFYTWKDNEWLGEDIGVMWAAGRRHCYWYILVEYSVQRDL